MKCWVKIYPALPFSLLLKSLLSSCSVDLNQYNGLCYPLTYCWSWTGSIQVLLLGFHHKVKQIPFRCLLLFVWFTSIEWPQSLSFLNEVKTNRSWQLPCSQFLCWTFCHGQGSSLRNTLSAAFPMYFFLSQTDPISTCIYESSGKAFGLSDPSLHWVMFTRLQLYYSKKKCKYCLHLELVYV